jgi:hypothetical protein
LDAAIDKPQYVERHGHILVITLAETVRSVPLRPEGYFADAYGDAQREERERKAFQAAPAFRAER